MTMASTMAAPHSAAQQPSANANTAAAPRSTSSTAEQRWRTIQLVLFTVGGILMPLGIVAIFLGWYGTAHTKYQYDQLPYVVSGGILGLGLVFIGGFLYFGAWLARIGNEQRQSARQLADAMTLVANLIAKQSGSVGNVATNGDGAALVLAGAGSTVHRRDCPLIAHRDDLHGLAGDETGLGTCRVCQPDFVA
jgi:hypothetical protein